MQCIQSQEFGFEFINTIFGFGPAPCQYYYFWDDCSVIVLDEELYMSVFRNKQLARLFGKETILTSAELDELINQVLLENRGMLNEISNSEQKSNLSKKLDCRVDEAIAGAEYKQRVKNCREKIKANAPHTYMSDHDVATMNNIWNKYVNDSPDRSKFITPPSPANVHTLSSKKMEE